MSDLQVLDVSELFHSRSTAHHCPHTESERYTHIHTPDKGESLVPSYFFPLTSKNIRWDLLVWHLANGKVRGECVTARGKVWRAHHTHKQIPLRSLLWSASLKFPLRQNDIWPNGFTLQAIASIWLAGLPAWWPGAFLNLYKPGNLISLVASFLTLSYDLLSGSIDSGSFFSLYTFLSFMTPCMYTWKQIYIRLIINFWCIFGNVCMCTGLLCETS